MNCFSEEERQREEPSIILGFCFEQPRRWCHIFPNQGIQEEKQIFAGEVVRGDSTFSFLGIAFMVSMRYLRKILHLLESKIHECRDLIGLVQPIGQVAFNIIIASHNT